MLYQGFSLLTANREVPGHPRVHEIACLVYRGSGGGSGEAETGTRERWG
jgi:hypothetical protein